MNKKQAEKEFRAFYIKPAYNNPGIPKGDKPMMRECWNNYTYFLLLEGRISEKQYNEWSGYSGAKR